MSWSPVKRQIEVPSTPMHLNVECNRLEIETAKGAHIQIRLDGENSVFLAYQDHHNGVPLDIATITPEQLGEAVRELISKRKSRKRVT